jgi:effector-binding domain-containing protein
MGMSGVFREVVRPEKLVATEKFDDAWYPGEAVDTTTFEQEGDITKMRLIVLYESTAARDTATRSGMEQGMIAGYNRLEELLASRAAAGTLQHLVTPPVVADAAPQLAAAIHMTIPRHEIRSVMGPGLTEIMTAVQQQGIGPAGPWFTHHLKMNPATFDFEICVPVSAPVAPVGRVVGREIPAARVVRAVYQGPYEQLAEGWKEFDQWMTTHGHVPAADLYETYTVGPESSPDAASWRTELRRPIATPRAAGSAD